jgi:hypothetical protein
MRVDSGIFRREGDYWTVGMGDAPCRLRHRKGLILIAHLLAHPDKAFHALELCSLLDPPDPDALHVAPSRSGNPLLDAKARQSYRARLLELREDLEEARARNDLARIEKLEEELTYLTRELARAAGLNGRNRGGRPVSERARVRITNVIRSAVAHVEQHDRKTAQYLRKAIKTGIFSSYSPFLDSSPQWLL